METAEENSAPAKARRWRWGTAALLLALVLAGFAISVAVMRGSGGGVAASGSQSVLAPADAGPLAALEARTKEKPDDGEAWSALASGYFETGRFAEAVTAYDAAIRLVPQRAILWSARGEARVMASERDPLPAAAITDFERALVLDPQDPRARYFLAVRQDLAGDHRGAIASWLALLADTPSGAAWEADLRRTIEQAGKINRIDVAAQLAAIRQPVAEPSATVRGLPGPSAEDLNRASAMRPDDQRAMAEGMVARLDARLKADPANVEGWIMLIRSRMTLGQSDQARAALAAAVAANPAKAATLREQAAALGVR
jgi:cytochrome c-type biogenesis protein CcmH